MSSNQAIQSWTKINHGKFYTNPFGSTIHVLVTTILIEKPPKIVKSELGQEAWQKATAPETSNISADFYKLEITRQIYSCKPHDALYSKGKNFVISDGYRSSYTRRVTDKIPKYLPVYWVLYKMFVTIILSHIWRTLYEASVVQQILPHRPHRNSLLGHRSLSRISYALRETTFDWVKNDEILSVLVEEVYPSYMNI